MKANDLHHLFFLRRSLAALAFALLIGITPFVHAEQPADLSPLLQAIEDIKRDYNQRLNSMGAEAKAYFDANNNKYTIRSPQYADAQSQYAAMRADIDRVQAEGNEKLLVANQALLKARGALLLA